MSKSPKVLLRLTILTIPSTDLLLILRGFRTNRVNVDVS